jgi:hypothetical protein
LLCESTEAIIDFVTYSLSSTGANTRGSINVENLVAGDLTVSGAGSELEVAGCDFAAPDGGLATFPLGPPLQVEWSSPLLKGTTTSTGASTGIPVVAALNERDVAYYDSGNDHIRVYRFGGSTFTQVGSDTSFVSASGAVAITALNETDIVLADDASDTLRTWRFNGTTFATVGNAKTISGMTWAGIAAISQTDIALYDAGNNVLQRWTFDGTDWTQVGVDLALSGNLPGIAFMGNQGDGLPVIAWIDDSGDTLQAYKWDTGTTKWAALGSGLAISGVVIPMMSALNRTDLVLYDTGNDQFLMYRFDGSTWTPVGVPLQLTGSITPRGLTAMSGIDVVLTEDFGNTISVYRFEYSLSKPPWGAFF